ncbi:MAG: protein phosphatase 2C domain-containing protein [Nitrososphaerota archaeon]
MMSHQLLYSALGAFSPSDKFAVTARIDFLHELSNFRVRFLGVGDLSGMWNLYASTLFGKTFSSSHVTSYAILINDKIYAAGGYCYAMLNGKWRELAQLPQSQLSIASGWLIVSAEKLETNEARKFSKLVAENPIPEFAARLIAEEEKIPVALAAIKSRITIDRLRGLRAMWCTTDLGMVRRNNEDGVSCLSLRISDRGLSSSHRLLAVADGAGGHGHGEIASLVTLQEVIYRAGEAILLKGGLLDVGQLREIVLRANERVLHARQERRSNMATTLTMILVTNSDIYTAHVGDSRAYYIDQNSIGQLTEDHKYVEELVKKGVITRQQARVHPQRNIITSALGMPQPRVDVMHHPKTHSPGARLLVCSDGLSDLLEDWEIHKIVMSTLAPNLAARQLVNAAKQRGGYDNISVALDFFL